MIKTVKKVLLIAIAAMTIMCFTACGSDKDGEDASASAEPTTSAEKKVSSSDKEKSGIYDVIEIPNDAVKSVHVDYVDRKSPTDITSATYWLEKKNEGTHITLELMEESGEFYSTVVGDVNAKKEKYGKNVFYIDEVDENVAKQCRSVWIGRDGGNGIIQCDIYSPDRNLTADEIKTFEEFLAKIKVK